jgi:hypothetical protein
MNDKKKTRYISLFPSISVFLTKKRKKKKKKRKLRKGTNWDLQLLSLTTLRDKYENPFTRFSGLLLSELHPN